MKTNFLVLGVAVGLIATTGYAAKTPSLKLYEAREQVTQHYILDLQNADYKDIVQLFEKNAIVISTSRGKVDAKEFFYSFLPNIQSAKTELHQIFTGSTDNNRMTARFNFAYKMKDGEEGHGEYIDEFVFTANSSKLAAVYMFENLKFSG